MVAAAAGDLTNPRERMALSGNIRAGPLATTKVAAMPPRAPLDRVANAVDGAESSYGHELGMWRPDVSGPQGPMQVSEAAASDVGGEDRFDLTQNRILGRAYLARLYRRYNNRPDGIAAYNWGLGKVDSWIRAVRPSEKLQAGVAAYTTPTRVILLFFSRRRFRRLKDREDRRRRFSLVIKEERAWLSAAPIG
jgi:Transglycosylase SLT domain